MGMKFLWIKSVIVKISQTQTKTQPCETITSERVRESLDN